MSISVWGATTVSSYPEPSPPKETASWRHRSSRSNSRARLPPDFGRRPTAEAPSGRTRPRRLRRLTQRDEVVGNDRDPIVDRARHGLGDKGCLDARSEVPERPHERSANGVTVGIQALDLQAHVRYPVRRVVEDTPLDAGDRTVRRRRPPDLKPALGRLFAGLPRRPPRRRREQDEAEPERQRTLRHPPHGPSPYAHGA